MFPLRPTYPDQQRSTGPARAGPARESLARLSDLIWPGQCVGCRRPGPALCAACAPIGPVLQARTPGVFTVAGAEYADAVRTALLRYKERGRRDLARPLAAVLARTWPVLDGAAGGLGSTAGPGGSDSRPIVVVPVPSTRQAARERGGEHVERLVRHARVTELGWMLADPNPLRLCGRVRDSAGLDRSERQRNLAGAMAASPAPWPGARVVIVDDIVTSGATISEAQRALSAAGWNVVGAAAVAMTRPRPARPRPARQTRVGFVAESV